MEVPPAREVVPRIQALAMNEAARLVEEGVASAEDIDKALERSYEVMRLAGIAVDALRRDIDIPKPLLHKWLKTPRFEPGFRDNLKKVYTYRKQVLAIFEELVHSERNRARLQ